MKQIRKKQSRIIPPRTILILAAAAALIMGTVVFFVLRGNTQDPPSEIHTASEYVTVLGTYTLDDIASVTITPPDGKAYTLLSQNGTLIYAEDPSFPLRSGITELIAANICAVRSENTVLDTAEHPIKLADFGLDPCSCMCSFQLTDGTVNTIRIGNQIVGGEIPYYYFMWNSDTRIFAGGTDMYSAFSYDRSFLHTVTQPSVNTDILGAVEIKGQNTLSLRYTDIGWQIASPFSYPADPNLMTGYLTNLSHILFSRYICQAEDADLKALGLEDPLLTLTVTEAESVLTVPDTSGNFHTYPVPETRSVFLFGANYDEYSRYVEYEGAIYTATFYLTDFLFGVSAKDLCLPSPFNLDIYQLTGLEAVSPSVRVRYDIVLTEQVGLNGALVTDEMGNTLYDCSVLRNGEGMDAESFLAW
ncbi:MAG: DUF4340 domain-containing protein, partial [Lachnospiraceae bacterium]|nr:DUF4340 domain-containing protein [Lachnospiraceae bacterium]